MSGHFCPRCCGWISEKAPVGESGIYRSEGVSDLCEPCFFEEEAEIEEAGTNDLPETLARYRANDKELNH